MIKINALQITEYAPCTEATPVVNKAHKRNESGQVPRIISITHLEWCKKIVAGFLRAGKFAEIRYTVNAGVQVCAVWRDGHGCKYVPKENEEDSQ